MSNITRKEEYKLLLPKSDKDVLPSRPKESYTFVGIGKAEYSYEENGIKKSVEVFDTTKEQLTDIQKKMACVFGVPLKMIQ